MATNRSQNDKTALSVSKTREGGAVLVEMTIAFPVFLLAAVLVISLCTLIAEHAFALETIRFAGRVISVAAPATLDDTNGVSGCKTAVNSLIHSRLIIYGMDNAAVTSRVVVVGGIRGLEIDAIFPIDCPICPLISWLEQYQAVSFFPLENQAACTETS